MKKALFILIAFCCGEVTFSQPDTALHQRLKSFIAANGKLDLETVLNYTYPKLFTIAPKDQMLDMMKKTFDNDQITIRLDSLKVDSLYPVFQMQQGRYAKVVYSMKMIFTTKEADPEKKKEKNESALPAMKSQFGENKVRLDSSGNIIVRVSAAMAAAKDSYAKEWCFVNLKDGDPLISQLFSKEVIDKLASFK